jgi:hypothetical protein
MEAHSPAPYDKNVLMAIRAMIAGTASEGQQRLGMDWIITKAANLYDMSYRPDAKGGARATEFHEGRRFVGNQIVKLTLPITLQALEAREKKAKAPKTRQEAKPNE